MAVQVSRPSGSHHLLMAEVSGQADFLRKEELQTSMLAAVPGALPTVYKHWDFWEVQPDREDWSG